MNNMLKINSFAVISALQKKKKKKKKEKKTEATTLSLLQTKIS